MTAEQLNLKYVLVDRKRDFEVIDFFEKNALTIQNLDESRDEDTLTSKANLFSDYGYSLAKSGQSGKAIPILKEALRLHEKNPSFEDNMRNSNGYKALLFLLGEAFQKTNKITDSREIFKRLYSISPDNESYKSWLIWTTNYKRNKISKVAMVCFVIWLTISAIFRDMTGGLHVAFTFLGLSVFIIWLSLDIKSYFVKRKYR